MFDYWQLWSLTPSSCPFCLASGKKARVLPPLVLMRSSNQMWGRSPWPHPQPYTCTYTPPKPVSFSCRLSRHFLICLGDTLPPESLIMWVINLFKPSWCVCGVISHQILGGDPSCFWGVVTKMGIILPSRIIVRIRDNIVKYMLHNHIVGAQKAVIKFKWANNYRAT